MILSKGVIWLDLYFGKIYLVIGWIGSEGFYGNLVESERCLVGIDDRI